MVSLAATDQYHLGGKEPTHAAHSFSTTLRGARESVPIIHGSEPEPSFRPGGRRAFRNHDQGPLDQLTIRNGTIAQMRLPDRARDKDQRRHFAVSETISSCAAGVNHETRISCPWP